MSIENKLPECPRYVAHPQAVWFNEHWRPVIEQLKAELKATNGLREMDIKQCMRLSDENEQLKSKLEIAKNALNTALNYLHWREDDLIGADCKGDSKLTEGYNYRISEIEQALKEINEG